MQSATVDIFDSHAHAWWDEKGPFKPLHRINPLRLEFMIENIKKCFRVPDLKGLRILDAGCGGGLICEPLARLGAHVTGIDISKEAIKVAQDHAEQQGLTIDYHVMRLEDILDQSFDVVIASEVIEHVSHPDNFVKHLSRVLTSGGCTVLTTLNRTWKSFVFGIFTAENILKWAPKGTHHYEMFIKPSELNRSLERAGLHLTRLQGLVFRPLRWQWALDKNMDINYFALAVKEQ